WHWPIVVLFRMTVGIDQASTILLAASLMLAVSSSSYHLVEQPFRRVAKRSFYPILAGTISVSLAISFLAVIPQIQRGIIYQGRPQQWSDWQPAMDYPYVGGSRITFEDCDLLSGSIVPSAIPVRCQSVDDPAHSRPRLLLIGDSHAYSSWGMGAYEESHGPFTFAPLTHDGCNIAGEASDSCTSYWRTTRSLAGGMGKNDVVLLSVFWALKTGHISEEARKTVLDLASITASRQVALIVEAPGPQFPRSASTCSPEWFRTDFSGCVIPARAFEERRAGVMSFLNELSAAFPNVRVWDPTKFICDGQTCATFKSGKPLFRDHHHFSFFGARSLGPPFVQFLETNIHSRSPASPADSGIGGRETKRTRERPVQ
ncbi:MAG TPA: SGNH hydrolase domain-containing protein, partial [Usitatibacter sp.]|nr:SGNH hydrolase domain-containing protein [Usitatibacter sp.]